jgi:hypothetical protein
MVLIEGSVTSTIDDEDEDDSGGGLAKVSPSRLAASFMIAGMLLSEFEFDARVPNRI